MFILVFRCLMLAEFSSFWLNESRNRIQYFYYINLLMHDNNNFLSN